MIWIRDFVELGSTDTVAGARVLAASAGVDWALERALFETEQALGEPRWNAHPTQPRGFGHEAVAEAGHPGDLKYLALMRELGPRRALRYLATRVDPRRFRTADGRVDTAELRAWLGRRARGIREALRRGRR